VLGLDYTEIADTRINVQLFQTHIFDRNPDIIPSTNENGYSLLVNHKFGDKVEAQALWIASLNRSDWMLRPRVSWNFEKNWRAGARCRYLQRAAARLLRSLRRQGPRLHRTALQLLIFRVSRRSLASRRGRWHPVVLGAVVGFRHVDLHRR
jgi:hypothetical protein